MGGLPTASFLATNPRAEENFRRVTNGESHVAVIPKRRACRECRKVRNETQFHGNDDVCLNCRRTRVARK